MKQIENQLFNFLSFKFAYHVGTEFSKSVGIGDLLLLFCIACNSCCCLFIIGVDVVIDDGIGPHGAGDILFLDADDKLKSTEPNGKLFGARAKAGCNAFKSSDG